VRIMVGQTTHLADQQRMVEIFEYMQSLGIASSFAPPPSLFPLANPAQFSTLVSIKILVLYDIYSFGLTNVISSLCRDNRRHQTTLMDHLALRRTSPTAHLTDDLLVVIVRLMQFQTCDTYICECW
jgi:hypothetical protein